MRRLFGVLLVALITAILGGLVGPLGGIASADDQPSLPPGFETLPSNFDYSNPTPSTPVADPSTPAPAPTGAATPAGAATAPAVGAATGTPASGSVSDARKALDRVRHRDRRETLDRAATTPRPATQVAGPLAPAAARTGVEVSLPSRWWLATGMVLLLILTTEMRRLRAARRAARTPES